MSFSLGPTAGHGLGTDANGTVGGRVGVRFHTSSAGLMVGAEQESYLNVGRDEEGNEVCCFPWRAHLLLGYSNIPLPHEGRIGFEAALRPGLGRTPFGTDLDLRAELGAQLALPIRVSPQKLPWKTESLGSTFWAVVPDANISWDVPDRANFSGGLSLRLHTWSPVIP